MFSRAMPPQAVGWDYGGLREAGQEPLLYMDFFGAVRAAAARSRATPDAFICSSAIAMCFEGTRRAASITGRTEELAFFLTLADLPFRAVRPMCDKVRCGPEEVPTNLTDRVAIVTGGAEGLGRATVQRLVEAGALGVVLVDLQFRKARSAAQEIMSAYGGQVLAIATDVSNPQQVEAMVQTAATKFGRIDILINNAGICPVVAWDDVNLENWNRILAVNLTGMFLCTRAVIPYMKALAAGRIVFISSPAAYWAALWPMLATV